LGHESVGGEEGKEMVLGGEENCNRPHTCTHTHTHTHIHKHWCKDTTMKPTTYGLERVGNVTLRKYNRGLNLCKLHW
jgi:hypothetical protein